MKEGMFVSAESAVRWTKEQEAAIEARGTDVLVSAAAGSGKTSVLVERLIRRILDPKAPVSVDRLLVVTFTESAAAEMKERIRAALLKAAQQEESKEAVRQLAIIGRATISTLHGFCLRVLRRHFYLIGLDPSFRVMDQEEASLLFDEAMDELFEEAHGGEFGKAVPGLDDLLLHYGGSRDDRDLRRIVGELYEYITSLPDGEAWLKSVEAAWNWEDGGATFSKWKSALCQAAIADIGQAKATLLEAIAICARPSGPSTYEPSFRAAADALDEVLNALEAEDWDASVAKLQGVEWQRLKSAKDADPLLIERAKELWDRAKILVRAWSGGAFCRTETEYASDVDRMRPIVTSLCALVLEFGRRYAAAKHKIGAVDFSDLERMALAILARDDERVAREYREAFDEVMVDEYQDINPVQDLLLSLVSKDRDGERNRFLVGDVKQSIYRFRLADPSIFQAKHADFADPRDPNTRRIDLQANFRSHPKIVDFVNYVFRQVMQAQVGGIEYGPDAYLHARGRFASIEGPPRVDIHLIERLDPDDVDHPGLPAVEREAAVVGRIIQDLVHGAREGDETPRYTYRDIAILMRSPRGRAARFTDVLEGMGVPVYARAGSGFFSAVEVETVLSLLRVLDNPRQDIPLAAVLRSPIGGFDSRDLARIRSMDRQASFFDAAAMSATEDSELGRRLASFFERIDGWRTDARRIALSQLLWQLYHETGYIHFVAALPRGRQREANLWGLYQRARQFDRFRSHGLDRFLAYVDGLEEAGEEIAPPPALGEGENVVQLISVHQSKGLEFPVVIVADLDRQWNVDETRRPIIFHRDLGIAPSVVDRDAHVRYPSLAHRAAAAQIARDAIAEELRLLYVALTRPKERLILVGSARDLESRCARWSESAFQEGWRLSPGEVLAARSHLDWIGRAAARHRGGDPIRALGAGDLGSDYYKPVDRDVRECDVEFSVRIWSGEEVEEERALAADALVESAAAVGPEEGTSQRPEVDDVSEIWAELERLHGWTYPYASLTKLPAKVTVTEIARLVEPDESATWETEFAGMGAPMTLEGEGRLTAGERGTAIHLALSRIAPSDLADGDRVRQAVTALVDRGLLTPKQGGAIDPRRIAAFFHTDIGSRIIRAPRLWRELSFTMRLESSAIVEEAIDAPWHVAEHGHLVNGYCPIVQGTIDCLAVDDKGALLVDYKTDRVRPGEEREAAKRYAGQIRLYHAFASRWLDDAVPIEPYIVFLETGAAVRIEVGAG